MLALLECDATLQNMVKISIASNDFRNNGYGQWSFEGQKKWSLCCIIGRKESMTVRLRRDQGRTVCTYGRLVKRLHSRWVVHAVQSARCRGVTGVHPDDPRAINKCSARAREPSVQPASRAAKAYHLPSFSRQPVYVWSRGVYEPGTGRKARSRSLACNQEARRGLSKWTAFLARPETWPLHDSWIGNRAKSANG